jgi:hypothetical protein
MGARSFEERKATQFFAGPLHAAVLAAIVGLQTECCLVERAVERDLLTMAEALGRGVRQPRSVLVS